MGNCSKSNRGGSINPNDGWAVGWDGNTIHWNGTDWSTVSSPTTKPLYSVYVANSSNVWAVGDSGTIIHWNGTAWNTVSCPTASGLYDVFMVTTTDGWGVGIGGTIIHYNGTAWSNVSSPTTNGLRSVFMLNSTEGWAVGDFGTIIHWNGTAWNSVPSSTTRWFFSVFMIDENDGWSVGDFGSIIHWNGVEWVQSVTSIYQGDLILSGDDVFIIENERFDINGSIIVEENATLVLNNVMINFTQTSHYQFNITLINPDNGNPRIIGNNVTFVSEYWLKLFLNAGSLANFNDTFFDRIGIVNVYSSNVNMSHSSTGSLYFYGTSKCNIFNCSVYDLLAYDNSNCTVQNSTLSRALVNPHQVNFTAIGLKQGFFNYWKFRLNCSVIEKPGGSSPDLTFINSQVDTIALLFTGTSEVTIMSSEISTFAPYGSTIAQVYNSILNTVIARINAKVYIYNSTIEYEVESQNNAKVWLVNSTSLLYDRYGLSEIFINWHLDVHVIDSIDQDIPSSNVTAYYPNGTTYTSQLTDSNGLTRLTLTEKMMNATGEYPVGNYTVEATYESYSNNTTVNMTGNQVTTLRLEDFIIPEFPSFIILALFMLAALLTVILHRRKHTR